MPTSPQDKIKQLDARDSAAYKSAAQQVESAIKNSTKIPVHAQVAHTGTVTADTAQLLVADYRKLGWTVTYTEGSYSGDVRDPRERSYTYTALVLSYDRNFCLPTP